MTTACVTLQEAKSYLRVDHDEEDALISTLIEASTSLAETRLRRPIIGDVDADNAVAASIEDVPADLRMAVCVIVAFWYENRTATDIELRDRVLRQAAFDRYIDWGEEDGSDD